MKREAREMAQILINGEQTSAKSGEEMPVVNPATEEEFETVPKAGQEDVDAAAAAAKEAFKGGSKKDPDDPAAAIRAAVAQIEENGKERAGVGRRGEGRP